MRMVTHMHVCRISATINSWATSTTQWKVNRRKILLCKFELKYTLCLCSGWKQQNKCLIIINYQFSHDVLCMPHSYLTIDMHTYTLAALHLALSKVLHNASTNHASCSMCFFAFVCAISLKKKLRCRDAKLSDRSPIYTTPQSRLNPDQGNLDQGAV